LLSIVERHASSASLHGFVCPSNHLHATHEAAANWGECINCARILDQLKEIRAAELFKQRALEKNLSGQSNGRPPDSQSCPAAVRVADRRAVVRPRAGQRLNTVFP
jgi:hypothetical protein